MTTGAKLPLTAAAHFHTFTHQSRLQVYSVSIFTAHLVSHLLGQIHSRHDDHAVYGLHLVRHRHRANECRHGMGQRHRSLRLLRHGLHLSRVSHRLRALALLRRLSGQEVHVHEGQRNAGTWIYVNSFRY